MLHFSVTFACPGQVSYAEVEIDVVLIMAPLRLSLLGSPQITLNERAVRLRNKAQAVLFYVAVEGRQSRRVIAGNLWSERHTDQTALDRLRGEVHALRQALPEQVLAIDSEAIGLNEASFTTDLASLYAAWGAADASLETYAEALALYRGPLLEGFELELKDAGGYVEWLLELRGAVEQRWLQLLHRTAERCLEQRRRLDLGIDCCQRLLAVHLDDEETHRLLMQLLAADGQTSAALRQFQECVRALRELQASEPSAATVQLYEQIQQQLYGKEPREQRAPFLAPRAPEHFAGRETLLQQVSDLLLQPQSGPKPGPVVALVGMGGIGKTTLATAVAHQLRPHFPDGVLWAHFAATEPEEILNTWARTLGHDFHRITDLARLTDAVHRLLADRKLLVIVDDLFLDELVRPAEIKAVVPQVPGVPVLLTTRDQQAARAAGAQRLLDVGELTPDASLELFAGIAGEETVAAEQAVATSIAAMIQHHPLALEIIGRRLQKTGGTFAHMHELLQAHLLEQMRYRTLDVRAVFEISWGLLTPAQRTLFMATGLFQGRPFQAAPVAALIASGVEQAEDGLFELVGLSLLRLGSQEGFVQHVLLAEYAAQQLQREGEPAVMERRYAGYYLDFARRNQTDYGRLEPEWDNIMAGMELAHGNQHWQLVLDYVSALSTPWLTRARYRLAVRGCQWAEEAATELGDPDRAAAIAMQWARAAIELNNYEQAFALLDRSLVHFRASGDKQGESDALYYMARIAGEHTGYGGPEQASEWLADSEVLKRAVGDEMGLAEVLYRYARLYALGGNLGAAERLCQEALARGEQLGNEHLVARALQIYAHIVDHARQDYALATELVERSQTIAQALEDEDLIATAEYMLAMSCYRRQEYELAKQHAELSAERYAHIGDRRSQGVALYWLSLALEQLGDYPRSRSTALACEEIFRAISWHYSLVDVLIHLGDLHLHDGAADAAVERWREARDLAVEHNRERVQRIDHRLASLPEGSA